MEYQGNVLTFDNYKDVLGEGWNQDILDEIRSALMDSLDITEWLEECREDPGRLQQIRVGMKEGIGKRYLTLGARELRIVRSLIVRGVNLEQLDVWLEKRLPGGHYGYITSWIEKGINIPEGLKLERCPEEKLEVLGYLLENGLEELAVQVAERNRVTAKYAATLAVLAKRGEEGGSGGVDDRFLKRDWNIGVLEVLVWAANRSYYRGMVDVLDRGDIDKGYAEVVYELAKKGFEIEKLQEKRYSLTRLEWVLQAHEDGLDASALLDDNISDTKLSSKYHELVIGSSNKLSGRL